MALDENNGKQSDSPEETDDGLVEVDVEELSDLDRLVLRKLTQPEELPSPAGDLPGAWWHLLELKRKLGNFNNRVDVSIPGALFNRAGWGFETHDYVDRLAELKGNVGDLKEKLSKIDHEVCESSRHLTDSDLPNVGFSIHYAIARY